ncbi:MAG: AMP-binding protein [Defluviicoccus sp.]|nr:AMP-binding protein [Defluviicoccus sp.]
MENGLTRSRGGATAPDDPAHLLHLIATLSRELRSARDTPNVSLDSRLGEDLGFDSLGRAELLRRIERTFSVSLPGSTLAEAEPPADLGRALEAAGAPRGPAAPQPREDAAPGPVVSIPSAAATLTEMLDWHAEAHPDRVHAWLREREDHIETVTYAELREAALAVSGGILDGGAMPGARVALMLPTCAGFLHAFFGILYAGCVPVPIYPPARPSQLADHLRRQAAILANAGAELLVTVPEARVLATFLRSQVASLRAVETVEGLRARGRPEAAPARGAGDVAFLQYTSGSTGDPKGVVLSHANLLANIRAMGRAMEAEPGRDVFVSWLPLYHDMGLIGAWLGSLHFAVPVSISSPLVFLARPESWLWEIHARRATLSGAPNFAFDLCVERIDDAAIEGLDLSSARIVVNGAEPVRAASVRAFCARFAAHGFDPGALAPVYGLAESSVGLAFPRPGRGLLAERIDRTGLAERLRAVPVAAGYGDAVEVVACGSPLPGHQFRVVDESGREMPERRQGRLQFTGPSATVGYHENAEATRGLFDGDWLETGDLAYIAGGEVYPTGRIKDVIIRGGRNIHPHELEAAIGDLPGIRRGCVAAFAAAGPDRAERLVVVAESREEDGGARDRLRRGIEAAAVDVAGIAPDDVVLAPPRAVLKTSSGKIRRAATRARYLEGRLDEPGAAPWRQLLGLWLSAAAARLRAGFRLTLGRAYAGYWWAVLVALALAVWPLSIALPRRAWRWRVLHAAARAMLKLTGTRLTVSGETVPDRGAILVANHCSYLDSLVLAAALPGETAFVAKAELAPQLFAGTFLRRIGALFVERFDDASGRGDLDDVIAAARAGRRLAVYPEGTLTRRPGLLDFKLGAFAAAAAARVPVVPVALRGTRSVLRGGQWFPRPGAVQVTVGARLLAEQDGFDAAIALRDAARAAILAGCGEPDLAGEATLLEDRRTAPRPPST